MIMGHSKHELSTKKHILYEKKLSYNTPTSSKRPPLHNGYFLPSIRWPGVVEKFDSTFL